MLVEIAPLRNSAEVSSQRIATMPVLVLNVHSRCHCRCIMCDIWKRNPSEELPVETLTRHRESLRKLGVRWVVLSGGEALMHSSFTTLCRFLRGEGIRLTLLTAGLSLAKHAQDVAYNVDDVIVSLDGPREVHDRIRGVKGAFDCLAVGMLKLLSLRPELPISARTTVQKANHAELCATVQAAQELDLSGISFLPADLTSAAFNRENGWGAEKESEIALSPEDVVRLESEIHNLVAKYPRELENGYIAESPLKLRRIIQHFQAHLGLRAPVAPVCNAPWVSAVVGHDGSVQPCFFHPAIGNLHSDDLEQIVNGPTALAFRESLDIASNPTCQRCVCSLHIAQGETQ